jgi:hypothetical protein
MFKPMLLKIMQINFYAQLFHDTYNGPFLPPEINAANYANVNLIKIIYFFILKNFYFLRD